MQSAKVRRRLRMFRVAAIGVAVALGFAPGATGAVRTRTFEIRGSVSHLYPGAVKPLTLTVINPFRYPITVTSIRTVVGNASTSCGAGYLSVTRFTTPLRIAPGGHRYAKVTVHMSHSAPNACQHALFPLHYRGIAVRP